VAPQDGLEELKPNQAQNKRNAEPSCSVETFSDHAFTDNSSEVVGIAASRSQPISYTGIGSSLQDGLNELISSTCKELPVNQRIGFIPRY